MKKFENVNAVKKLVIIISVAIAVTTITVPAYSQWLGPHLESQRWNNIRRSQQRRAKKRKAIRCRTIKCKSTKRKSTKRKPIRRKFTKRKVAVVRQSRVQVKSHLLQSLTTTAQRRSYDFVPVRSIFGTLDTTIVYSSERLLITAKCDSFT